jgi:hypothetical protein
VKLNASGCLAVLVVLGLNLVWIGAVAAFIAWVVKAVWR